MNIQTYYVRLYLFKKKSEVKTGENCAILNFIGNRIINGNATQYYAYLCQWGQ